MEHKVNVIFSSCLNEGSVLVCSDVSRSLQLGCCGHHPTSGFYCQTGVDLQAHLLYAVHFPSQYTHTHTRTRTHTHTHTHTRTYAPHPSSPPSPPLLRHPPTHTNFASSTSPFTPLADRQYFRLSAGTEPNCTTPLRITITFLPDFRSSTPLPSRSCSTG